LAKANKEIDEWMSIAAELKEKYPVLFEALVAKIGEDEDPEEEINSLNRAYESGEPNAKQLIREVSDLCLEGFRETMRRVGVTYDSWDWESDFVWGTQVSEVLAKLKDSPFVHDEKGVLEFNAEKVVEAPWLKVKLD
jgi:arginyl-tRNA synthetase